MIAVGLGSPENARRFSEVLQFPLDVLYAGQPAEVIFPSSPYRAKNFEEETSLSECSRAKVAPSPLDACHRFSDMTRNVRQSVAQSASA